MCRICRGIPNTKRIGVVTGTRAEYGLLKPIIKKISEDQELELYLIVTGAHLSPEFGLTYREIEQDGYFINKKIQMLLSADTPNGIVKSMGVELLGFADAYEEAELDAVVLLGDRYEMLVAADAAMIFRIPIIHLYGGELTEGAVDDAIRHAITKMSYLHLTSTEEYRKRVIQLGEDPERVFTVGAVGVENVLKQPLLSKEELERDLGMNLDSLYAVVTFHPVTLENSSATEQCQELLAALDVYPNMKFVITKANADADGRVINQIMEEYARTHDNVIIFDSLGMMRYLSAVKYSSMVIGNSSSGLVEVPSFHIPTVNIGDRQKGRIRAESVIDCKPEKNAICSAIEKANSDDMRKVAADVVNPYGDGNISEKVCAAIKEMFAKGINLKKKFYDIEVRDGY